MNKFLIKHPLLTEKATDLSELGKYVFLVDKKATAPEIKKLIQLLYKVEVDDIHLINIKPKPKQWGRLTGFKSGYKKAIVTLKSGQKLDIVPR